MKQTNVIRSQNEKSNIFSDQHNFEMPSIYW